MNLLPEPAANQVTQRASALVLGESIVSALVAAEARGVARWLLAHHGEGPWVITAEGSLHRVDDYLFDDDHLMHVTGEALAESRFVARIPYDIQPALREIARDDGRSCDCGHSHLP